MEARLPWARRPELWAGGLVVLGLALRLYHYLREPSVWHDEAALILNVIGKNFAELLGPLYHAEAAPPLFLWLERAAVLALGDGTFALRLLPFVASCLALVLLWPIANRLLRPQDVPYGMLLFACSDRLLWHACEAKPYALDVLAAVVMFGVFVWGHSQPLGRRLLVFGLSAPVTIFLCYPGCFLYGGVLVALLPAVWQARRPAAWVGYAFLTATVFASFGLLALGPARAQRCAAMDVCWVCHFPNWKEPWTVPGWCLKSSVQMVRYCCGAQGRVLSFLALVGAVCWWRRGRRSSVVFLTVPVGLALVAAFLGAYPYGGVRVMAYATPALVLLIAAGFAVVRDWLAPKVRPAAVALAIPLLVPLGAALYRVAVPWPRPDCAAAAAFVLQHRGPTDPVLGNSWESFYYFRHVGPRLELGPDMVPASGSRYWVVASNMPATHLNNLARRLARDGWRLGHFRPFEQTAVLLFERGPRTTP